MCVFVNGLCEISCTLCWVPTGRFVCGVKAIWEWDDFLEVLQEAAEMNTAVSVIESHYAGIIFAHTSEACICMGGKVRGILRIVK